MGLRPGTVEGVGLNLFGNIYRGRRVLLTGHTGFKGSWLALWLSELGAEVSGVALDPETTPNHWQLLGLEMADRRLDIRHADALHATVAAVQPELVFHLAAQPLVRRSYTDPLTTWSSNVMGTANLFEACRHTSSVKAIVAVTTDKCYENLETSRGYVESDRLGGHDPYSASKAASELVAASYRSSFFAGPDTPLLATARAGNVIGGGDWSEDRLIPDLVRATAANEMLTIRSPFSTRPWQHVLESLSGYLLLGWQLLEGRSEYAEAWNFGPGDSGCMTVEQVLGQMQRHWPRLKWWVADGNHPHETCLLHLDSCKARTELNWRPVWTLPQTLNRTAEWYRSFLEEEQVISREQLEAFIADARRQDAVWIS